MTAAGPDLILHNAAVYTVDPDRPWASAVAVADGRVVAVGSDDEVLPLAKERTVVRDLGGRMMMPGIVDGHSHLMLGGAADYWELTIDPSDSLEKILDIVRAEAERLEPGTWIIGGIVGSLVMGEIKDASYLARLDDVSPEHPVLLRDDTQHNRWVNSRTLDLMGVTADTPDPEGGFYVRDAEGQLTGVLWELACRHAEEVAQSHMPDLAERKAKSAQRAIEILNSFGITATQEAATFRTALAAFRDLDESGALNAWVVASLPARDFVVDVGEVGDELFDVAEEYRTAHLRPDFIKGVVDGIPMSYTAAFLEPYAGDHHHHDLHYAGTTYFTMPELVRLLDNAHRRDLGVKLHALGDGSVRLILDAVEVVRDLRGPGLRAQIAHVAFVHPDDLPRFAELGVVADLSPAVWWPNPITEAVRAVLDDERMDRIWPFRDLDETGALLIAGSDWPCANPTPSPWLGIEAMVTRADPTGSFPGELNREQGLDLETVLRIYTHNAAVSMGLGDEAGQIAVGRSADLIVLDQNLFEIAPERIHRTQVDETYFAGRQVYSRG
ncbi:amidohydrolase [Streptomyces sp. NPDC002133]|uniref:amidohydrolase n=1 Tax=Streptomyces sp. NPDC002133 TaxID=3154409 RepID=UPI00332FD06B